MTPVAIIGVTDTLAGQMFAFLKASKDYHVRYFLSFNKIFNGESYESNESSPSGRISYVRNSSFLGLPVINHRVFERLLDDGINNVFVLEGNGKERAKIFELIKKHNISVISYIHPSTLVCSDCVIEEGAIIFPNCYLGYKAKIGRGSILQSGVSIDHHSWVGAFCDLNPRVTIAGLSTVKDFVEVNMCVDIANRVSVGTGSRIGAGSLVLKDCEPDTLYYGRPVKSIRSLLGRR